MFEDVKGATRIHISKNRQHTDQKWAHILTTAKWHFIWLFVWDFPFRRFKLILHVLSWNNLWLAHYMWNPILNLRWMVLPCVENKWLIFNTKFSSQTESQMNNYMLLGTSIFFSFYCVLSSELSKFALISDFFSSWKFTTVPTV